MSAFELFNFENINDKNNFNIATKQEKLYENSIHKKGKSGGNKKKETAEKVEKDRNGLKLVMAYNRNESIGHGHLDSFSLVSNKCSMIYI